MNLKLIPFNKNLFWKDWKITKWITILASILIFFDMPLRIYSEINRYNVFIKRIKDISETMILNKSLEVGIEDVFNHIYGITPYIILIYPIIIILILFGEERRNKTMELMTYMPYSKYEIFFNKVLVGVTNIVIPYIINGIIILVILATHPVLKEIKNLYLNIMWIMNSIIVSIAIMSFSLIFATLTANSIGQIALTSIFIYFPAGITVLLRINMEPMMILRQGNMLYDRFYKISLIMHKFSPVDYIRFINTTIELIILIIVSIMLILISKKLFDKNKNERNGELLQFKNLELFFKAGVTICVMLTISPLIFQRVGKGSIIGFILIYAIGALIGLFISKKCIKLSKSSVTT
ncbi:ABC-2 family transporter protein [Gottschalkia purinilytica]|uniref:ABC-2 family transporter protein n=1 Tax=Gottschalkia purinilytica TaxID=1503 RepID=A0A0L0WDK3_GOTPU|nr:hypothetical protein [Gottschalkia purinilytica]KNF09521.1 ABC-2 family transporter protein [Gottschalkia purinilytica]